MIKAYSDVTFAEASEGYIVFEGGKALEIVFLKSLVPERFQHLLGASASMYGTLNDIHNDMESFIIALDAVAPSMDQAGKEGVSNIVSFMQLLQSRCLNVIRLAEVGGVQFAKEFTAGS